MSLWMRLWMVVLTRNAFAAGDYTKSGTCVYEETCYLYHFKQTKVESLLS